MASDDILASFFKFSKVCLKICRACCLEYGSLDYGIKYTALVFYPVIQEHLVIDSA